MFHETTHVLQFVLAIFFAIFTIRRILFSVAALLPARPAEPSEDYSIAVLISMRNEEYLLPNLLQGLDQVAYPHQKVRFVLVNDGSTDATGSLLDQWIAQRPESASAVSVLQLAESLGKAAALQCATDLAKDTDLYVVFDADCRIEPDCLAWLAGAFDDAGVGAAGGYPSPLGGDASIVSRYAALERWVHQLTTLAGKDRLGMNPAISGAVAAYRRAALEEIGGFPLHAVAEDVEVTCALHAKGWKTRWIGRAVVHEGVVSTFPGFWRQRQRWSATLAQLTPRAKGFDMLMVSLGYVDRILMVLALALAAGGHLSAWWLFAIVVGPAVTLVAALWLARPNRPLLYLASVVPMALIDVASTAASMWTKWTGQRPPAWNAQRDRDATSIKLP